MVLCSGWPVCWPPLPLRQPAPCCCQHKTHLSSQCQLLRDNALQLVVKQVQSSRVDSCWAGWICCWLGGGLEEEEEGRPPRLQLPGEHRMIVKGCLCHRYAEAR